MSASTRKQGTMIGGESTKHLRKSPKFGPNGTKYGSKAERKHRERRKEWVKANATI